MTGISLRIIFEPHMADESTDEWFARQLKRAHPESAGDIDAVFAVENPEVMAHIFAEIAAECGRQSETEQPAVPERAELRAQAIRYAAVCVRQIEALDLTDARRHA